MDKSTKQKIWISDGLRIDRAIGLVWQAAPQWTTVSSVFLLVQGVLPLAYLYVFKLVVDELTGVAAAPSATTTFESLLILIGIALSVAIIGNFANGMLGYATEAQTHLVTDRMQRIVQDKSVLMDLEYYENSQYHDQLHRAQREAPTRPLRIVQGIVGFARNSLTLLATFALLFTFHWAIVVAVAIAVVPVIYYRLKYSQKMYQWYRDKTQSERRATYFNELMTSSQDAKEVRVYGFGNQIKYRFEQLRKQIRKGALKISADRYRKEFFTESTAAMAAYGSLAFITYEALKKSITLGDIVMYFGAFQVALTSLRGTLGNMGQLYENNLFLSTLYEFLALKHRVSEPITPQHVPQPARAGFCIDRLHFHYPGMDRLILEDIHINIRPGQMVALVGKNGSGKTTLVKLLCRLYDPTKGRITLDGIDIRQFNSTAFRREIGVIFQDFGKYHMTARENIWLGFTELAPEDPSIVLAAKRAGVHDDLLKLPQEYDTVLSRALAAGAELSIGQWQKLALARAFLREAQLIVLDEPTSAMDAVSEYEFFEKFRELVQERMALVISHRFSTVKHADFIYVLDKGRVIEQGTHNELLSFKGIYENLYQMQASRYQDELQSTQ
jgi:ATP-binding cassette subfamily B protein